MFVILVLSSHYGLSSAPVGYEKRGIHIQTPLHSSAGNNALAADRAARGCLDISGGAVATGAITTLRNADQVDRGIDTK